MFNRTIFNLIPPRLPFNDRFSPCSTSNWLRKYKKISNISSDRSSSREGNDRLRDSNFPSVKLYLFHGRYSFTTYFPSLLCLFAFSFPSRGTLAEKRSRKKHKFVYPLPLLCKKKKRKNQEEAHVITRYSGYSFEFATLSDKNRSKFVYTLDLAWKNIHDFSSIFLLFDSHCALITRYKSNNRIIINNK